MILVDGAGKKFQGRSFFPREAQSAHAFVLAGLTEAQAEAKAIELAATYKAAEIERHKGLIASYADDPRYVASMAKRLAELEAAPVGFVWRK